MPVKDPRFPGAVLLTLILAMILSIIPLGEYISRSGVLSGLP